ncbi:MAG: hypothetical protein H6967_08890 [Chromatiaceae bacterium]|nr:hypothetical protein [Chromatiaceae bacterium]
MSLNICGLQVRACAEVSEQLPLPPSIVHRLLACHGLLQKPTGESTKQDRPRFAFARAGQLWMSDVMRGPSVTVGDRSRRKTDLIAFLDDATWVVPYVAFALSENTTTFLPTWCHQGQGVWLQRIVGEPTEDDP